MFPSDSGMISKRTQALLSSERNCAWYQIFKNTGDFFLFLLKVEDELSSPVVVFKFFQEYSNRGM